MATVEFTLWCDECRQERGFYYDFHGVPRCRACKEQVNDSSASREYLSGALSGRDKDPGRAD